jgi:hypothetical protein
VGKDVDEFAVSVFCIDPHMRGCSPWTILLDGRSGWLDGSSQFKIQSSCDPELIFNGVKKSFQSDNHEGYA